MSRLVELFDCFLLRRLLTGNDAGRVQDEQSTATRVGYRPEPPPTVSNQAQAATARLQSPLSHDVLERPYGEHHSRENATSEGYSDNYHQIDQMTVYDMRSSPRKIVDSGWAWRSCPAHSGSSKSDLSDETRSGGYNDGDEEEGSGGERFCAGYARRPGVRYYSRYNPGNSSAPARTATQPLRLLSSRDMEVIGALFHHPEVVPAPRETEWDQFTRTMTGLGFSMRPGGHAGGSRRRFEVDVISDLIPAGSEGEPVFAHQPHAGRTTLALSEMRDIGRRLTGAFGWSAETFERE
ncbi:hypothetical protein F4859DRAFT_521877 [Xylaria cf. heliscus]|nr:hypothetical protein F4859DRAFT_521877 [Xylaria cf. heliscus]